MKLHSMANCWSWNVQPDVRHEEILPRKDDNFVRAQKCSVISSPDSCLDHLDHVSTIQSPQHWTLPVNTKWGLSYDETRKLETGVRIRVLMFVQFGACNERWQKARCWQINWIFPSSVQYLWIWQSNLAAAIMWWSHALTLKAARLSAWVNGSHLLSGE